VQSIRISRDVPLENVNHRLGFDRSGNEWLPSCLRFRSDADADVGRRLLKRNKDVTDRVGFTHHADRQANPKHAFDPKHQLGSAEAIDAEVAIKPAGQAHVQGTRALAMQLAHKVGHDRDEAVLVRVLTDQPLVDGPIHANRVAIAQTPAFDADQGPAEDRS
jgi:hypothetical protein